MANTEFYQRAQSNTNSITWKDIFSEFTVKHSKQDTEYAFLAGTSLDGANESDMLSKWRKPWLFWRVFLALGAVGALSVASYFISGTRLGGINSGILILIYVILPMIVPITLAVLFWELNIPRNISIYELLGFFFVGAVICFFATQVMYQFVLFPDYMIDYHLGAYDTWLGAPLREEPAKLAASVALLLWFSKRQGKRVYGLTGLAIGAAVGTGFSVFESIAYSVGGGVSTAFVRLLFAVVGHTMFCAPYSGAIALHMKDSRLSAESFFNADFAMTFAGSFLMHLFWNSWILSGDLISLLLKTVIVAVVLWGSTLYILRKSLNQAVAIAGGYYSYGYAPAAVAPVAAAPYIRGVSGFFTGCGFWVPAQGLRIGRGATNDIAFPDQYAEGISRNHCTIYYDPQSCTFVLTDQNSSYGTYLENGMRLTPGLPVILYPGQAFYLATNAAMFRVAL